MKKIAFALLFLGIAPILHAQIKVGGELGFQMTNADYTSKTAITNLKTNGDLKPAFKAGIIVDVLVQSHFAIQPGLYYTYNNLMRTTPSPLPTLGIHDAKSRKAIHGIQLPLHLIYKTSKEGRGRYFIGAGGYATLALAGTQYISIPFEELDGPQLPTYHVAYQISNSNIEINNDAAVGTYRPFEFGLSATTGYELPNGIYFRGHVQRGLTNTIPGGSTNNSSHNWNFGVSFGLFFGDGGGGYDW